MGQFFYQAAVFNHRNELCRRYHLAIAGTPASQSLHTDDLAVAGVVTHVLGDAQKCGNIRDAIGDGYKVACEL